MQTRDQMRPTLYLVLLFPILALEFGVTWIHCRGSRSLKERVRWDIIYFRKESFVLDLWILLRTISVVIRGQGNC